MNKHIIMLILVISILFSGCVQMQQQVSKKVYVSTQGDETITLYSDNTLTAISSKNSFSGVYRIDGNDLIMTFSPFGTVVQLKISETLLKDEKTGETWQRI